MRTVLPKNAQLVPPQAERVFKGIIYDVYQWRVPMYDGTTGTFEMLKRPDTIEVLAIKGDKLVIIEESQPDKPDSYFGLPGGRHDHESETELDAAKREVLEETGMTFKSWRLINAKQTASKIEHFIYRYLAYDFESQTDQRLDGGEKIAVSLLTLDAAKDLIKDARNRYLPNDIIADAHSIEDILNTPEYQGLEVKSHT